MHPWIRQITMTLKMISRTCHNGPLFPGLSSFYRIFRITFSWKFLDQCWLYLNLPLPVAPRSPLGTSSWHTRWVQSTFTLTLLLVLRICIIAKSEFCHVEEEYLSLSRSIDIEIWIITDFRKRKWFILVPCSRETHEVASLSLICNTRTILVI